ncbi:MAG: hypothetical protein KGO47_08580 [Cyanobacteria bacterium REEB417]|nr:hypothetical protein [Cyanobacteria bacterium REEB417]
MARNARRNYVRDNRGRFASTPGGGPAKKAKPVRTSFRQRQAVSLARQRGQTGRLGSATKAMKAKLAASRKKLATNASPQQKAAVTRAARMAAMLAGQRRIKAGARAGVLRGVAARGVKKAAGVRVRNVRGDGMSKGRPGQLARALGRAEANKQRLGAKKEPSRKLDNGYAVNTEAASLYSRRSRSTSRAANSSPVSLSWDAGKKVVARRMAALRGKAPEAGKGKGTSTNRKRVKGEKGTPKALPVVKAAKRGGKGRGTPRPKVVTPDRVGRMVARIQARRAQLGGRPAQGKDLKSYRTTEAAKKLITNATWRRYGGNNTKEQNLAISRQHMDAVKKGRPQDSPLFKNVADAIAALKPKRRRARRATGTPAKSAPRGKAAPAPAPAKPTRPTSKVAAPGSRRKVRGPKMAGTIVKPKGLKPGALAERRGAPAPTPAPAKSTRTVYRTRQQAVRAQRERNRQLVEFGQSAPEERLVSGAALRPYEDRRGGASMRRRSVRVPQGNLLTGRVDMAVIKTQTTFGGSLIGPSAASRRTAKRRARAQDRYEALLRERKAITSKGRARKRELARNFRRMSAVADAFSVYDMGTGRRPPRKRTGRR